MPRIFCVEVERTTTYRRKVWVEVEETDERLKDTRNPDWKNSFKWDAEDAARSKAPMLTGWEPHGEPEYRAVISEQVEQAPNIDVMV